MYAVFVDGSRQYQVSEGDRVKVDFRDVPQGGRVEFGRVILFKPDGAAAQIGQPVLEGMRVVGEAAGTAKTKLQIQHFTRRKNSRRLRGHTQPYTVVTIKHILQAGQEAPATS